MLSLRKSLQLLMIISCLFIAGASCTQADESKKSTTTSPPDMTKMMNPMMMGQMGQINGMMNPHMYMNMMNPMMMGSGMMNPHMYMNMMNPMMSMMGPMSGGMGANGSSPMSQMPGGQMMDPKQYEQWYSQWTEMVKNMPPQPQATQ